MADIELHEIPPSPNSVKVRIALHFKEVPFERIPLEVRPGATPDTIDRSKVIAVSHQPLTPVLVHDGTVIFDSAAILRYLDANFPDTKPLFSTDFTTMKAIEEWEWFARTELSAPLGMVFRQAMADDKDAAVVQRASQLAHELSGRIERRLETATWLVGDHMTAADVTAAPLVNMGMLPPEAERFGQVAAFFRRNLSMGENRDRTRAWVRRVLAYDRS